MIADTIEFCLTHENEIRMALEEKKDGANRGVSAVVDVNAMEE